MRLPSVRRPSPSMAVSVMALVVASTGTSYAAGLIGSDDVRNNSIKSVDVKDNNLKGRDVKNGSIGSMDVRDESLKARDFAPGQLPAGAQGPAGVGRWALVDAAGAIVAQSGGFSVTAAYPTLAPMGADVTGLRANGNVYINAGEDLTDNGIVATIALQNTLDQNGDGIVNGRAPQADANPEFSGEIGVSICGLMGTACAPPDTGNTSTFVVSPRLSDGTVTTDDNRKRFYVVISGDSSDMTG
jgi:hypothetical protein